MQQPEEQRRLSLLIQRLCETVEDALGENLTGIYLHGSVAMGYFNWNTGDVDCLIVTAEPLGIAAKTAMIDTCLALQPLCPPKGLELSVVTKAVCENPQRSPAFEFHFSPLYVESYAQDPQGQLARMPRTDPDLIVHFSMVRSRGRALLGAPAKQVFAPIPRLWLLDSIQGDLADAAQNMEDQPVYYVLNFCRALACLEDGQLLSKQEGGEWGLRHLPSEYRSLVEAALTAYAGGTFVDIRQYPVRQFIAEMWNHWKQGRADHTTGNGSEDQENTISN